jgi:aspartyl-tRNA(Asn)/glutamyl-tRNA(Gln) amidotransferase subunit C
MRITEKDVIYVADLANLELTRAEIEQFVPQLDSILSYAEKLNELDTSAVEPMAQVMAAGHDPAHTLRDDEARASLPHDLALANAPQKGAGHFKVPKVIER